MRRNNMPRIKITITEDSTPHWKPQFMWGIDTSRLGKVFCRDWWKAATLKDVEMMNDDGPYLDIKCEEGKILDFALKYAENEEVIVFLKRIQKDQSKD